MERILFEEQQPSTSGCSVAGNIIQDRKANNVEEALNRRPDRVYDVASTLPNALTEYSAGASFRNVGNKTDNLESEKQLEVPNATSGVSQTISQNSETISPRIAPLPLTSAFKLDDKGGLSDPSLTDDSDIIMAPSFIVPYIYERPPKETFMSFKESIEKLSSSNDKMEENNNKEPTGHDDVDKEVEDESCDFFGSKLGRFIYCLGMNLVQEHVQENLIRQRTQQNGKNPNPEILQDITSLKEKLGTMKQINTKFHFKKRRCHLCTFKTESELVLQNHLEKTLHFQGSFTICSFCSFTSQGPSETQNHMLTTHGVKPNFKPNKTFKCSQCEYEGETINKLSKHKANCYKGFKLEKNQEPTNWEPPAKYPRSKAEDYILQNRDTLNKFLMPNTYSTKMAPINPVGSFNKIGADNPMLATYLKNLKPISQNDLNAESPHLMNLSKSKQPKLLRPNISPIVPARPVAAPFFGSRASNFPYIAPKPFHSQQSILRGQMNTANGFQNPRSGVTSVQNNRMRVMSNKNGPTESPVNAMICEVCDYAAGDYEILKNHVFQTHRISITTIPASLRCSSCARGFYSDEGLRRHLLGFHSLISPELKSLADKLMDGGKCPLCHEFLRSQLVDHVRIVHNKQLTVMKALFPCHLCDLTFDTYQYLNLHSLLVHKKNDLSTKTLKDNLFPALTNQQRLGLSGPGVATSLSAKEVPGTSSLEEVVEISDDEPEVATSDHDYTRK